MRLIDFRIRPPFKGFLRRVMYSQPERRDRLTRQLGMAPSVSATEKTCDLRIKEMDEAGIDSHMVVGRNSGSLGSALIADVMEFVQIQRCGT